MQSDYMQKKEFRLNTAVTEEQSPYQINLSNKQQ